MKIEDLEVFVAAAESDTFITPLGPHRYETSASEEILRLEEEFGTLLFLREGKNTGILTEAGEKLLDQAKPLIRQYRRILRTMDKYSDHNDHTIMIGTLPILKQYRLNRVLSRFEEEHEDIDMKIETTDGRTLITGLNEDYYDAVIVRKSMLNNPEKYKTIRMATDEMAAILPTGHKYATQSNIRLTRLKNELFYLPNPNTQSFGLCWNLLKDYHISTENARTADISTILNEVADGKGVALMPISTLNVNRREGVIAVPLQPRASLEVVFAVRKNAMPCDKMQELIDVLENRSKAVPSV